MLHEWRDFFMAVGTASATLIGAMFVVASIGMGFFTRDHAAAIRSFLTPTVIHLSAGLFASILTMVPTLDWRWFGLGLGGIGLAGLAYSGWVANDVAHRRSLEWVDHFWYAALPFAGYAALVASAAMALTATERDIEVLAIAVVLLIIGGIRNAWDMIVFLIIQDRGNNNG